MPSPLKIEGLFYILCYSERMIKLATKSPDIELIEPNIERDAPIAVRWLEGDIGKTTLRLMGNSEADIKTPTLEEEKERIKGFLESEDQITWMISLHDKPVGAVWVNLKPTEYLAAPSVHIMIGDTDARGHGVGGNTIDAVMDYLRGTGDYQELYTRHLVSNVPAGKLFEDAGFSTLGESYEDDNGLSWQNAQVSLA